MFHPIKGKSFHSFFLYLIISITCQAAQWISQVLPSIDQTTYSSWQMLDTVNQLNFAAVKFGGFSSVWVIISLAAQGPHAIFPPPLSFSSGLVRGTYIPLHKSKETFRGERNIAWALWAVGLNRGFPYIILFHWYVTAKFAKLK